MRRPAPFRFGVSAVVMGILLTSCGTQPVRSIKGAYTVKAGDTLYSIAWRHGVDYHEVARLNHIGNDYTIHPGQVLILSAATKINTNVSRAETALVLIPSTAPKIAAPHFLAPTQGGYIVTTRPNGGLGLVFNGRVGQEIRAAASGRVVYSGTGLLGYGQLLIIKHNEQYLSAYGHLQTAGVKEGEAVTAEQVIATMGNGPNGAPQLYFEIRVDGRPVDPGTLLQTPK